MDKENDPRFFHYLAEGNIICHLNADNHHEAIAELCDRLAKNTAGLEAGEIFSLLTKKSRQFNWLKRF